MIKAVIFDLDNTLLDFMKMKSMSIDAAIYGMIEAGLDLDPKFAKKNIYMIYDEKGYEYQEVFNQFIIEVCGEIDYRYLAAAIVSYRKAKEASLTLYPDVNSTLIKLSKMGMKLGVVSDAPSREAWIRIFSLNMHHVFDKVVTFDDTNKRKPSKEPFQKIIDEFNIPANEMIMVGDWPERDVIGAKQVGMKTAFAKYGDTFGTINSGADYDLENISQLYNIVLGENGE
tara:strand:- start:156 stop:839 length:684 start_codon:yes stop_codon:yes gene_type:complete